MHGFRPQYGQLHYTIGMYYNCRTIIGWSITYAAYDRSGSERRHRAGATTLLLVMVGWLGSGGLVGITLQQI